MEVQGAFDSLDHSMSGNLSRLEFIRRYMEKGLDTIQPNKEAIKEGLVFKPSGHTKPINYGWFDTLLDYVLNKPGYYLATGWLVDKWIAKRSKSYQWPEDVLKLCAEGADVSAWDTKVITPKDDLFYGEIQGNFAYFDRNGNEVS